MDAIEQAVVEYIRQESEKGWLESDKVHEYLGSRFKAEDALIAIANLINSGKMYARKRNGSCIYLINPHA